MGTFRRSTGSRAMRMITLLLPFGEKRAPAPAPPVARVRSVTDARSPRAECAPARGSAQERYATMTRAMLAEHRVRVMKWRSSTSGVAWERVVNGKRERCIESPRPKGPMSAAVFLHEIGHHALGVGSIRPRCLEEYHAWMFAIREMERWNIRVTERVEKRVQDALLYAVVKAKRRGLKRIPGELVEYLHLRA